MCILLLDANVQPWAKVNLDQPDEVEYKNDTTTDANLKPQEMEAKDQKF